MKKILFLLFIFKFFSLENIFSLGFDLGHKLDENTLNSFKGLIENMKIGLNEKTINFLKDYRMKIDERTLSDLKDIFENLKIEIDGESLNKLGEILTQIKIDLDKETFKKIENLSNKSFDRIENILKIIERVSNRFLITGRNILIVFFAYKIIKKICSKKIKFLEQIFVNK